MPHSSSYSMDPEVNKSGQADVAHTTHLDREIVDRVSTKLAHAEMAVLARPLEQCDPRLQERDLFLLLLKLYSLLLYFLVGNTLRAGRPIRVCPTLERSERDVRSWSKHIDIALLKRHQAVLGMPSSRAGGRSFKCANV